MNTRTLSAILVIDKQIEKEENIKTKFKTISILVCSILIFAGIVWASKIEYTSESVRIIEIGNNKLVVRSQSGEIRDNRIERKP
ncbi:hypothetical protein D3C71_730590 [compost metagenome]